MRRHRTRQSWRHRQEAKAFGPASRPHLQEELPLVSSAIVDPPGTPTADEAKWPLERWVSWATQLVTPEISERADQLARQQMMPNEPLMNNHEHTPTALAMGIVAPYEAALSGSTRMVEIFRRYLLLELGQALSMIQNDAASARVLGAVAQRWAGDPQGYRAAAVKAVPDAASDSRARHFEREVFQHWAAAVERLGRGQEELVHKLAVRRELWGSYLQRPLDHYQRSLRRRPFWASSELPAARALEAAFPEILAECQALMREGETSFATYHSRVVTAGGWSDVQFYAGCKRDAAHCAQCPTTARVIAAQPRINSVIYGSHFFSRLVPGTHLSKHCGPSNFRLRCHLGLVVPPKVRIRVGTEIREWKAGECLIFDDSFEHEVWHDGDADRVVLICDLWHPDVSLDTMIIPLLNAAQREAMDCAVAGRHLPLQQRTYSTGKSVSRVHGD